MNSNELVILTFEKARQNIQNKKPNVLVTLTMITRHLANDGSNINFHRVRNFMRHFETYIVLGKNSKLYQDYIDFYSTYLEIRNQNELQNKYATELQNLTQLTENLKKLNEKNPIPDIPDNTEKTEKSETFTEKEQPIKKEFRTKTLIGVVLFGVLVLLLVWFRKPQPFINIENFTIGTQYYYATDRKGNYVIGTFDNLQNPKPLTPQVFDAYFQQQGLDTLQPEVKFIKANYFNSQNLIIDTAVPNHDEKGLHQADPMPSSPKTPDPKPQSVSKNSSSSVVFMEFVNSVEFENELLLKFNQSTEKQTFTTDNNFKKQVNCKVETKIEYAKSQILKDVVVCRLFLIYSFSNNTITSSLKGGNAQSQGAGFTESEALQNALTKLIIPSL